MKNDVETLHQLARDAKKLPLSCLLLLFSRYFQHSPTTKKKLLKQVTRKLTLYNKL